jgi:hypothetical protein
MVTPVVTVFLQSLGRSAAAVIELLGLQQQLFPQRHQVEGGHDRLAKLAAMLPADSAVII